jgi:hypothetical protein
MAKHDIKSKRTGFTDAEIDALSRIYDVADAADRGSVYINNLGGNLAWRLRGAPELVELFSILERRFGGIDSDSVNWDLVEVAMGCKNCVNLTGYAKIQQGGKL